jgi:hypothetical protein
VVRCLHLGVHAAAERHDRERDPGHRVAGSTCARVGSGDAGWAGKDEADRVREGPGLVVCDCPVTVVV